MESANQHVGGELGQYYADGLQETEWRVESQPEAVLIGLTE